MTMTRFQRATIVCLGLASASLGGCLDRAWSVEPEALVSEQKVAAAPPVAPPPPASPSSQ